MDPEVGEVAVHMKEFGLNILGRAIYDSTFSEMTKPYSHALSVVHAAQGAEIVVKAMIAEKHPLLIFKKLPSMSSTESNLTIAKLFESGRSYEYEELPERLWAVTGYRFTKKDEFIEFGKLRNKIVHFAVPPMDHSLSTLKFCIEVMEPLINHFWNTSALPYAEEWDEEIVAEGHLEECLKMHEIEIPEHVNTYLHSHDESK